MKKIVTLLIFVLSLNTLFAQEWASVGTVWTYDYYHIFGNEMSYNTIESVGDTVINNQPCKILQMWKGSCDLPNFAFGDYFGDIFTYEQNDTVFFYNPDLEEFVVFYDFTAEVGDSWTTKMPENIFQYQIDSFNVEVQSTFTYNLAGQDVKAMDVIFTYNGGYGGNVSTIYEYLGEAGNMFSGYTVGGFICDDYFSSGLRCFENDAFGHINFRGYPCDTSWLETSTDEEIIIDLHINLYPNPVKNALNIRISNTKHPRFFEIYSFDRQLLYQKELLQADWATELDVRSYETGVYFWILKDEKGIVRHGKFLVKD